MLTLNMDKFCFPQNSILLLFLHYKMYFSSVLFTHIRYHAASAAVKGQGAFRCLRFESGIHRVQRVPVTERTGRIHTR